MFRIWLIGVFLYTGLLAAQDVKFSVEVSADTILLGNYFELKFTIENANADFEAPDLSRFNLVGGPNTSSRMSIINGKMSQSMTYAYFLEPKDIGNYTIPPAYATTGETTIETPPIDIIVVPNPDGIYQQPHRPSRQIAPGMRPKPEKKTKRPRKKF